MQAWVNKISIGGMKAMELKHSIEPRISKKPVFIILYCGINYVMNSSSSPQQIGEELKEVATSIRRLACVPDLKVKGLCIPRIS